MAALMLLMLVTMVRSQETTPDYTVTYNPDPDMGCLPDDDSVVPDCLKFMDPISKQPYYHPHSYSKMNLESIQGA